MRTFYVYIVACRSRRLYIGVTNNLVRRIYEHKAKLVDGFTRCYNMDRLVYYELVHGPIEAVTREKQLKGLLRAKKIQLIEATNPSWRDLYSEIAAR